MEIVSSYKVQILNENSIFKDTIRLYRCALSFLIRVFDAEWDALHSKKSEGTLQCRRTVGSRDKAQHRQV